MPPDRLIPVHRSTNTVPGQGMPFAGRRAREQQGGRRAREQQEGGRRAAPGPSRDGRLSRDGLLQVGLHRQLRALLGDVRVKPRRPHRPPAAEQVPSWSRLFSTSDSLRTSTSSLNSPRSRCWRSQCSSATSALMQSRISRSSMTASSSGRSGIAGGGRGDVGYDAKRGPFGLARAGGPGRERGHPVGSNTPCGGGRVDCRKSTTAGSRLLQEVDYAGSRPGRAAARCSRPG